MRYPKDLKFVGMMQYDGDLLLPKTFLVPPPEIKGVSGEYLAKNGISTFACSEVRRQRRGGDGGAACLLFVLREGGRGAGGGRLAFGWVWAGWWLGLQMRIKTPGRSRGRQRGVAR